MGSKFVDAISHPGQRNKVDGRRTDDTMSRWLAQKRTMLKGNYDRVLNISESAIETQMPNLQSTNLYTISPDFHIKSVSVDKDCLTLYAKPDPKVRLTGCPCAPARQRLCVQERL